MLVYNHLRVSCLIPGTMRCIVWGSSQHGVNECLEAETGNLDDFKNGNIQRSPVIGNMGWKTVMDYRKR